MACLTRFLIEALTGRGLGPPPYKINTQSKARSAAFPDGESKADADLHK